MRRISQSLLAALLVSSFALAEDSESTPRPIPATRPEMKQLLEDMKQRTPRIPLPELTAADKEKLGERADQYETRLRYHFLPGGQTSLNARPGSTGGFGGFGGFGFSREPDPKMSLDYAFKTELFWIVSRTNNCQYCLGHQESKLLAAGLSEDRIAALDGSWIDFAPKEQIAYGFARKLTIEPHLINDADIERLRKHFTDLQILEMTLSIAGNNAINRWKEGAGIPQSHDGGNFGRTRPSETAPQVAVEKPAPQTYLTPTSDKFAKSVSKVAALTFDEKTGSVTTLTVFKRAPLEPRSDAEKALAACATRTPRLPLLSDAEARELLKDEYPAGPLPQWVRLLANFPKDGKTRILSIHAAEQTGDLKPLLKAQVAWLVARQDRSWYAASLARQKLKALGQSDDQIFALDGDWASFSPAERAQFKLAVKLSATPVVLTDADVAAAVKQVGPRDVTQLISYVTTCASFDRITEVAGLAGTSERNE